MEMRRIAIFDLGLLAKQALPPSYIPFTIRYDRIPEPTLYFFKRSKKGKTF